MFLDGSELFNNENAFSVHLNSFSISRGNESLMAVLRGGGALDMH